MTAALQQAVTALAEQARSRADEIETARQVPADLAAEMAAAGLFRMLVPAHLGGLETHPRDLVDAIETLARGDASTGWVLMIGATTGMLSASLREDHARAIYGEHPDVITCGVTAPMGRARRVEGGYLVDGRWPFGSASPNAQWICGGSFVVDGDGRPEPGASGAPDVHLMFFPTDEVTKHDNWHTSGMRGSGSGDIEVSGAFVPEGRSVVLGGRPGVDRPLYRFPTLGLLALGVASVALGAARRAVDELVDMAGGKKPQGSRRVLAERATVQADVGRAEAALRAARAYMDSAIDRAWARAEAGERLTTEDKLDLRMAAVHATWSAVEATDRMYHAGGGSAIYETSPLQRCMRDVHVATQHIMVAQPVFEVTGRVVLGLDAHAML